MTKLKITILFSVLLLVSIFFMPHQARAAQPIGWQDYANCTSTGGWAWDSQRPNSTMPVHVYADNVTFLGEAYTNVQRDDINAAFHVTGTHGWDLAIPGSIKDGQNHAIYAYGIDLEGGQNALLSGSPKTINCAPSATITASPMSIAYGGSSTISWSSTNTSSCTVSPAGWTGTSNPGISTGVLTTTTTYSINCTGGTASASVTVTVGQAPPTCSSATPDGAQVYGNTTQRFSANGVGNATSVLFYVWSTFGSGDVGQDDLVAIWGTNAGGGTWYADENLANHVNIPNSPGYGQVVSHVYMFNADNGATWCNDASYNTIAPAAVSLTANPTAINYDNSSTLSWTSTSVSSCTLSPSASGVSGGTSNAGVSTGTLTATTTYTVTCTGSAGGSVSSSKTVTVGADQAPTGWLDGADCNIIGGWAYDPDHSGDPIAIHIYYTNPGSGLIFLTDTSTTGMRSDVNSSLGISGTHGYTITTPSSLKDGQNHQIYVYGIDADPPANHGLLNGSGASINCPPASVSILANNQSGSISINYNTAATLSWTTTNATSCTLSPAASGVNSGTSNAGVSTGNLTTQTIYTLSCIGPNGNGSGTVTVNINSQPTCTSATPDGDWTIATSGTRTTYANGVTNATRVLFYTWSDSNGQDDLTPYEGTNLGGGRWSANINLVNHSGLGPIYVHVYLVNNFYFNPPVWCNDASFTRLNYGNITVHSDTSTSWTLTCPLVNPACPSFSDSGTDKTYTDLPTSTWMVTPANRSGYTVNVTPNNPQTGP